MGRRPQEAGASPDPSFSGAWAQAEPVSGWLTRDQGRMLWDEAMRLRRGSTLIEIGSHQGRSTIVLASAAQAVDGAVMAIDPFVEGRLFGGLPTKELFLRNVRRSGLSGRVHLIEEYSTKLRPRWDRPCDYLYIDGKHDYWTASDDLRWRGFLSDQAPLLIHDCFSSIGVTLAVLRHLLWADDLRYERRAGSLALFRVAEPSWRDRLRILVEVPWWLKNVVIKVLLRLRLRGVARALGHDSPYDPY